MWNGRVLKIGRDLNSRSRLHLASIYHETLVSATCNPTWTLVRGALIGNPLQQRVAGPGQWIIEMIRADADRIPKPSGLLYRELRLKVTALPRSSTGVNGRV